MNWLSIGWSVFLDITGIAKWLENRQQQQIGEQKQVNADLNAVVAVQQRVNEAEANVPRTNAEWRERAERGEL